jgi:sodium pump decarboxylase gamma subunit
MKFLELFFKGGEVTGLGMIAIFAIIAVIFLVIKGLGAASTPKTAKKAEAPVVEAPAAPAEAPVVEEAPAQTDDLELIAVLAAAISAYTGEPVTKFRVVSFKHIK